MHVQYLQGKNGKLTEPSTEACRKAAELRSRGDDAGAERILLDIGNEHSEFPWALYTLGEIELERAYGAPKGEVRRHRMKAETYFKRCAGRERVSPSTRALQAIVARAHYALGLIYHDQGNCDDLARNEFESAVNRDPDVADAYFQLAHLSYKKLNYPEARRYAQEFLSRDPECSEEKRGDMEHIIRNAVQASGLLLVKRFPKGI